MISACRCSASPAFAFILPRGGFSLCQRVCSRAHVFTRLHTFPRSHKKGSRLRSSSRLRYFLSYYCSVLTKGSLFARTDTRVFAHVELADISKFIICKIVANVGSRSKQSSLIECLTCVLRHWIAAVSEWSKVALLFQSLSCDKVTTTPFDLLLSGYVYTYATP